MAFDNYTRTFARRQVVWYVPGEGLRPDPIEQYQREYWGEAGGEVPTDPSRIAIRTAIQPGMSGSPDPAAFAALLEDPDIGLIEALVIGTESFRGEIYEELIAGRDRLSGLKALFLGDMVREEGELSWLEQAPVAPIFDAYPSLEVFRVRGVGGLTFADVRHRELRSLAVESGGLPATLIYQILSAELPALEHLELWLGSCHYGGERDLSALMPFFRGEVFPNLKRLGLRDSELTDEIARELASSPLLDRLEELDLSLGTLSDSGAEVLLQSGRLGTLKRLDIHHHFVSPSMVQELKNLVPDGDYAPGEDTDPDDDDRFIAHAE